MNYLELDGKNINLDNIAFISSDQASNLATINFIGGQSITLGISYATVGSTIKSHCDKVLSKTYNVLTNGYPKPILS